MKTKKFFGLILAVVLMVIVTSCGLKTNNPFKVKDDELGVAIIRKGYGSAWLDELIKAYNADNANNGKKAIKVRDTTATDYTLNTLHAGYGAGGNNVDLIFSIYGSPVSQIINAGYGNIADMSDIYDDVLEGYENGANTLNDLLPKYYKDSVTFVDGKQYGVPWALGLEGIVYNSDLFEANQISVPRTTDEMLEVMGTVKGLNLKNQAGNSVYGFIYSGKVTYTEYLLTTWWTQYEGIDRFYDFLEGYDSVTDDYSYLVSAQQGRLEALKVLQEVISAENSYTNYNSLSYEFTTAQSHFLLGEAFMMANGDWIEREMESSAASMTVPNIHFMKMPIISSVIKKLPKKSFTDDITLRKVVDYVDGVAEKPANVNDEDIAYIRNARSVVMAEPGHTALVLDDAPATKKEMAKDFLRYMFSAKGQNIVMQYSKGNRAPLNVDASMYSSYRELTDFGKEKQNLIKDATVVGRITGTKMTVYGGLQTWRNTTPIESKLGVIKSDVNYKDAIDIFNDEKNYYMSEWNNMMSKAGLSYKN